MSIISFIFHDKFVKYHYLDFTGEATGGQVKWGCLIDRKLKLPDFQVSVLFCPPCLNINPYKWLEKKENNRAMLRWDRARLDLEGVRTLGTLGPLGRGLSLLWYGGIQELFSFQADGKISYSERIYAKEIGKCYKSELSFLPRELTVVHQPAHHWGHPSPWPPFSVQNYPRSHKSFFLFFLSFFFLEAPCGL